MLFTGGVMMPPVRKESLVTKAMENARNTAMEQLLTAAKAYVEKVKQIAYGTEVSRSYEDFAKHRKAVESSLTRFEAAVLTAREPLNQAFVEYDQNVREIDVWASAARAADKITNAMK